MRHLNYILSNEIPTINHGDTSYFIYLLSFIFLIILVIYFRHFLSRHMKKIYIIFFTLAVFQRVLINFWYVYNDFYTLDNSLPLQICRVVVWLIIIQCILRTKFLNHIIFYFGLFAAAAFVYPIGIMPFYNIAGIAFFIMHAINLLFPLVMYVTGEFKPSIKGALAAGGMFTIYYVGMIAINDVTHGNYFFIEQRPFLHDLSLLQYSIINIVGTALSFILVAFILKRIDLVRTEIE